MTNDTLDEWLPRLTKISAATMNNEIYEWALPVDRTQVSEHYKQLVELHAQKTDKKGAAGKAEMGARNSAVGALYEKLLRVLFGGGGALSVEGNVRTTTNEIDLLLKIEPIGVALPLFQGVGTHIIGEAKCHAKPPSSELVNETRGILELHSAKCAFLFVFCSSRSIAMAARQAIAMLAVAGISIVPVGRKQLEQVIAGAPVCRVLSDQRVHAANHLTKLAV
jgi:hypothetical protein